MGGDEDNYRHVYEWACKKGWQSRNKFAKFRSKLQGFFMKWQKKYSQKEMEKKIVGNKFYQTSQNLSKYIAFALIIRLWTNLSRVGDCPIVENNVR